MDALKPNFVGFFLLFLVLFLCAWCVIFTMTIQVPINRVKFDREYYKARIFSLCTCLCVFLFLSLEKKEEAEGEIKILRYTTRFMKHSLVC